MANHKSAIKRIKQNATRRAHHRHYRSAMRTQLKSLHAAIADGDSAKAQDELKKTTSVVQRLASKGIIHRSQAARRISRLSKAVNAI